MMYLTPVPKQFVDYSGVPISNGTISVYDAGTTDFANIYQDAEGTQLLNNPARLDSYGMWKCFVPGSIPLDYVVKDANGNVIATYENLVPGAGSGSDNQLRIINKNSTDFNFSKISDLLDNGNDVVILVPGSSGTGYFTLSRKTSSSIVFTSVRDGVCMVLTLYSDDTSVLENNELDVRYVNKNSTDFTFANVGSLIDSHKCVIAVSPGSSGTGYYCLSKRSSSSMVFSSLEDGKYSVLTLNSDDTSTLVTRTIASGVNVFVAEYHVTPFADIKAAYDSGAYVVLKMGPPYLNLTSVSETEIQFGSVYKYSGELYNTPTYSFFARVNNNDEWANLNVPILVPEDNSIDYDFNSGSIKARMQSTVVKGWFNGSKDWFKVAELEPRTGSRIDNWIALKVTFESYDCTGPAGLRRLAVQELELGIYSWTDGIDASHVQYESYGSINYDPRIATAANAVEIDECFVCIRDGLMELYAHANNRANNDPIIVASASVNEMNSINSYPVYDEGVTRQPWKFMGGVKFENLPPGFDEIIRFYASEKYDTVLSDSSENAVQNREVHAAISNLESYFLENFILPNTLRFSFGKLDYDPTVAGVGSSGTWKKLKTLTGNVWDWTFDSVLNHPFENAFTDNANEVSVIAAGDIASTVTNTSNMFYGCTSLVSVYPFDTSSVSNMSGMFYGCTGLKHVPLFDTSSATATPAMFMNCINVESGALALYNQASSQASPPGNHSYMFTDCGADTTAGAAELAQIPASWGGTL